MPGTGNELTDPEHAERVKQHLELRLRGLPIRKIAEHTRWSAATVWRDIEEALAAQIKEPAEAVLKYELDRLDVMQAAAVSVLEARHLTVSNGKVITWNGQPVVDDSPVLNAIKTLLEIQQRRSKYLGLDAPEKSEITHIEITQEDLELNELINAQRTKNAAERESMTRGAPS